MTKRLAVSISNYTIEQYDDGEPYGDWRASYEYSGVEATLGGGGRIGWNTDIYDVKDEVEALTPLWVVVVVYGSGDTFGYSTGNSTVAAVCYSEEDAEAVRAAIWEDNKNSHFGQITVGDYSFYNGTWKGYFEDLEGVIVEKVRVEVDNG